MSVWVLTKTEIQTYMCVCACDLNVGCVAVSGPLQGCASLDTTSTQAAPQPREREAGRERMVAKKNEAFQRVFVSTEKTAEDTWGKPSPFFSLKRQKLKTMWRRWKKQKINMRGK